MNEIIDNANLDKDLKSALRKSLSAIYEHQEKILAEIKAEVAQKVTTNNFVIATALVPRDKVSAMTEKNFYAVKEDGRNEESYSIYFQAQYLEPENIKGGAYFLKCPYNKVAEICSKRYTGKSAKGVFEYELTTHTRFIEQEKKIFRLAELYNFEMPIIFSPYARRAVDIKILDANNFDISTADFDFKNNFGDLLIADCVLMWNICAAGKKTSNSTIAPTEEENFYRYSFNSGIDKDSFILPSPEPAIKIEKIQREDNRIDFITSAEWTDDRGEILKIFPVNIAENFPATEIFFNKFNDRFCDKKRLRTVGDINYLLKTFSSDKFNCQFLEVGDKAEILQKYQRSCGHNYYTSPSEQFIKARAKLPKCLIKFSAPELYLIDYANFVLHFLNTKFPEYFWAGVAD